MLENANDIIVGISFFSTLKTTLELKGKRARMIDISQDYTFLIKDKLQGNYEVCLGIAIPSLEK